MKIGILSRSPQSYSTRRLVQAVRRRRHEVVLLDVLQMSISLEEESPDLFYRGKPLADLDAVIPRVGASVTFYGTAVVRQFEQMQVFTANPSIGISSSRDKLRSLQKLSRHKIGIPATEFVKRRQDVLPAIERVGGAPVIIKLLEGTQGIGVILAETIDSAQAIIETLQSTSQNVLIQKFVAESRGRDIRALVVGDRVVAAMRRRAAGDEFRSNVHRGGSAMAVELDDQYEATAVQAAQILGLRIAGVDMLEGAEGPQVMEVNSSPGLQGIEAASQIDVAGAIVEYVIDQVRFPDVDLRQRLMLSRGYGVAEVPIPEDSELVGKTLAETGLRDRDVSVLTLHRESKAIANPRSSRVLEVGDRLLCFGKLDTLRGLMPEHAPPRLRRLRKGTVAAAEPRKA
ncbi:MAG: RimK family alpha-L-glutamate ligase [Acidobacteriota bacterium]